MTTNFLIYSSNYVIIIVIITFVFGGCMDNQNLSQNEFSLTEIFYMLLNYIRTIVISTLFIGIIAGIYAFAIATETYESNVDVYITPVTEEENASSTDYSIARYLITTIAEYIESDLIADTVIDNLNLNVSTNSFQSKLAITASSDSYRINIKYEDSNPSVTQDVVNEVASVVIANQTSDDPTIDFLPDTINLVPINTNESTYAGPNKVLYVVIGFILGGIIGVGIAFVREMINNSFKTKEQLESEFDLEVLGVIPEFIIKEDF